MLWWRSSSMVTICTGMWRVVGVLLEAREHGPAEHVGQEDVERDRGRPVLAHQAQRLGAAVGDQHLEAARAREVAQHRRVVRVVLDDQQRRLAGIQRVAVVGDLLERVGAGDAFGCSLRRGRASPACACDVAASLGADVVQRQVQRERAAFADVAAAGGVRRRAGPRFRG